MELFLSYPVLCSHSFSKSIILCTLLYRILGHEIIIWIITLMYWNRLHAWWSTQSRLVTLLSSSIACGRVGPQTLWRFQLQDLSIDERVRACWCVCGRAHRGLFVGFLLPRYSVVCTVESLSLFDLLFISWFVCTRRWCMRTKHLFVLIHIRHKGEVGTNMFNRSSSFLTDRSKVVLLLWILFVICVSCLSVILLSCLFLTSLWASVGDGWLLSSLVCCVFLCFVTFPYGVPGQVWCLIVSIHDLCLLLYFTFTINRLYNSLSVFSIRVENNVNPDQMALPNASWSGSTLIWKYDISRQDKG